MGKLNIEKQLQVVLLVRIYPLKNYKIIYFTHNIAIQNINDPGIEQIKNANKGGGRLCPFLKILLK